MGRAEAVTVGALTRRAAALLSTLDKALARENTTAAVEAAEALCYLLEAAQAVAELPRPEPWSDGDLED